MTDSADSSNVENLKQLSLKYESQRSTSTYVAAASGAAAVVAIISAVAGLFLAWQYYNNAIETVKMSAELASNATRRSEEISSLLGETRAQISSLNAQLEQLRTGLLQKGDTKVVEGRIMTCPDGYYVKGWTFQDQAGLEHGALWGPSAVCARLNIGK